MELFGEKFKVLPPQKYFVETDLQGFQRRIPNTLLKSVELTYIADGTTLKRLAGQSGLALIIGEKRIMMAMD